ncbi:hypothetical protein BSNK01_12160 [Bacillaceae bacterium]
MATRRIDVRDGGFVLWKGTFENPISEIVPCVQVHTWDLKIENEKIIAVSRSRAAKKKRYVFPLKNGTLFLYNGTGDAYAYFRERAFQDFLDRFGLTKIVQTDPNKTYQAIYPRHVGGEEAWTKIYTDGKKKHVSGESYDEIVVSNATYVVFEQKGDRRNHVKILYTLRSVQEMIAILPEALREEKPSEAEILVKQSETWQKLKSLLSI